MENKKKVLAGEELEQVVGGSDVGIGCKTSCYCKYCKADRQQTYNGLNYGYDYTGNAAMCETYRCDTCDKTNYYRIADGALI